MYICTLLKEGNSQLNKWLVHDIQTVTVSSCCETMIGKLSGVTSVLSVIHVFLSCFRREYALHTGRALHKPTLFSLINRFLVRTLG